MLPGRRSCMDRVANGRPTSIGMTKSHISYLPECKHLSKDHLAGFNLAMFDLTWNWDGFYSESCLIFEIWIGKMWLDKKLKIISDQQILALCNWDSILVWNLLSIENFKLCRLKNYLPNAGSMNSSIRLSIYCLPTQYLIASYTPARWYSKIKTLRVLQLRHPSRFWV